MVIVATTDTMQKRINKCSLFNEKCLMRLFYLVLLLFLCSLYWSFVYRFTKQTRTFFWFAKFSYYASYARHVLYRHISPSIRFWQYPTPTSKTWLNMADKVINQNSNREPLLKEKQPSTRSKNRCLKINQVQVSSNTRFKIF